MSCKLNLSKFLLSISLFIFILSLPSYAIKIKKDESYEGTFKDNFGNIILLPPGKFIADTAEKDGPNYMSYEFYNRDNNVWASVGAPRNSQGTSGGWKGGLSSFCNEYNNVAQKIEKLNNTDLLEWCVFEDDGWLVSANIVVNRNGFQSTYYYFDTYGIPNLSVSEIEALGQQIFNEYKKTTLRKSQKASLSFLDKFYQVASTEEYLSDYLETTSTKDDDEQKNVIRFCQDGNGVVYKRSGVFCDALVGESEISQKEYCYRAKNDKDICKSNIKEQLAELKDLLEEGLITQEQYDNKSTEILNDF